MVIVIVYNNISISLIVFNYSSNTYYLTILQTLLEYKRKGNSIIITINT